MEGGDSDLNLLLSSSHPIGLAFLVFQIETGVGIQVKFGLELKQCRVRIFNQKTSSIQTSSLNRNCLIHFIMN